MVENARSPARSGGVAGPGKSSCLPADDGSEPTETVSAAQQPLTLADLVHRPIGWRAEIRNGRKTKLPHDPETGALAQSDNPQSWATLGAAEAWAIANGGNVGLMFAPVGGLHTGGIDLDTCRNPETGEIEPWAKEVIDRFQTYAEVSPSETGVKLFFTYALADKPEIDRLFDGKHGRSFKNGNGEHPPAIEIYRSNRFFTVTEEEIGPHKFLRQVSVTDLRWLLTDAAPRLLTQKWRREWLSNRHRSITIGQSLSQGSGFESRGLLLRPNARSFACGR